jgi:hypothetical protein
MTLTNEQLQQLKNYINTIPTQYGIELLTFFAQIQQQEVSRKEADKVVEDKK